MRALPDCARPHHPSVGAPLVRALPDVCAPSLSIRRGAPCGCPPPLCAPSPSSVGAPLVRALPDCAPPHYPSVGAPLVGALPPCACPPRGLDSIDETSTLFLLPCIGSSVSLQKRVKLLPLLVGSSISRHPTIVANLSVLNKRQRALKTKNQKLKTTHSTPAAPQPGAARPASSPGASPSSDRPAYAPEHPAARRSAAAAPR